MDVEDRGNALLSKKQREFLAGETEFGPMDSPGRTTRTRLRKRIQNGLQDFEFLANPDLLDNSDLELLFDDEDLSSDLWDSLIEMIAFVYRAQPRAIESLVEEGLTRGVARNAPEFGVDEVSIQINKQRRLLISARDKMESGEALFGNEVIALLQSGDIEAEEVANYVSSQPAPKQGRFRSP